jgi:1,4-dihydroxy-2-naphthoyl-CoA hydrolase
MRRSRRLQGGLRWVDIEGEVGDAVRVRGVSTPEPIDNPAERARQVTEFFSELVPGQLGCVFDHSARDLVTGHIDVTENLIAGTGFLFAPAIIALADGCAAIGCGNNIPEDASFTTIELKTNFLSSATVGERVTCRCTPVHIGRQTHVWDAEVTNESTGCRMALFRCTQMVLSPK